MATALGPGVSGQSTVRLLPAVEAWQTALPAPPSTGGAIDAQGVYVPMASGEIAALARSTGEVRWTRGLDSYSAPRAMNGTLYVSAGDGLHALDAATGETRWHLVVAPSSGEMALAGALVVVPLGTGGLAAVRQADGQPAWTAPMDGRTVTALAADAGSVYATIGDGHLAALSLDDGSLRWERPLAAASAPPAVARDRVFTGTSGAELHAHHSRSGRPQWRFRLGGAVAGVAAGDDLVYVATLDQQLRAFNRGNGHQRWRQGLETRPLGPPRLVGDHLAVAGIDPLLSLFRAATGTPAGTFATPAQALLQGEPLIDPAPDAHGVTIVVILRDGRVLGLRSGSP